MGRGWRPVLVGGAVVVGVFALAQAQIFAPSTPAGASAPAAAGDAGRGATVFQEECSGCHGDAGQGGVGPQLAGSGVDAAQVTAAVEQGRGIMPAGLVSGQDEADVVAYVVSISGPSQ
jgi:mono/diheme cytochrome c family protein